MSSTTKGKNKDKVEEEEEIYSMSEVHSKQPDEEEDENYADEEFSSISETASKKEKSILSNHNKE